MHPGLSRLSVVRACLGEDPQPPMLRLVVWNLPSPAPAPQAGGSVQPMLGPSARMQTKALHPHCPSDGPRSIRPRGHRLHQWWRRGSGLRFCLMTAASFLCHVMKTRLKRCGAPRRCVLPYCYVCCSMRAFFGWSVTGCRALQVQQLLFTWTQDAAVRSFVYMWLKRVMAGGIMEPVHRRIELRDMSPQAMHAFTHIIVPLIRAAGPQYDLHVYTRIGDAEAALGLPDSRLCELATSRIAELAGGKGSLRFMLVPCLDVRADSPGSGW